ncbi:hypothetical protein FA13DRAFT_1731803, partial [Coprinellus micaceus]
MSTGTNDPPSVRLGTVSLDLLHQYGWVSRWYVERDSFTAEVNTPRTTFPGVRPGVFHLARSFPSKRRNRRTTCGRPMKTFERRPHGL